ncbi:MAG: OmpA family protein [Sandaracinaceae bacterium]|nr:OmpA family protein [Sandaracinaceae bacterium]
MRGHRDPRAHPLREQPRRDPAPLLRALNQLAAVIASRPDIRRVSIEGHTDSRGRDQHNLRLSQQRAHAVREYLVAQGIAGDRLASQGFGEERPVESNNTPAGQAANRRVEFVIVEQSGCQD